MDPRRLRIGEWLLGAGGVFLLVTTFLDWYDVDSTFTTKDEHAAGIVTAWGSASAWEAFSVIDVLLALVAALAIGAAVMAAAHPSPAVSLALSSLTALVGMVATIAILVRVFAPPEISAAGETIPSDDVTRAVGAWLGLAAGALTTVAAFAAMRDERFPRAARMEVPVETIPPPEGGPA